MDQVFDKQNIKPIANFQSLDLSNEDIVNIWSICHAVLQSGKYDGTSDNWYSVDVNEYNILIKICGQIIGFRDVSSRKVYEHFVLDIQQLYSLQIRDGCTNFNFPKKTIREIFVRPRITTLIGELREFQYKLLHGAMYTKEHLWRFGFVVDNLCSFCNQEVETYLHLFWDCTKVQSLWKDIIVNFELLELRDGEWQDIHVGISGNSLRIKCCNSIIFIIKLTIYRSRSEGALPNLANMKKILFRYREEEKKIAAIRGKLGIHLQKWESVKVD